MDKILDLAKKNEKTLQTSLGGSCYQKAQPWRNPKTKYYASIQSYPQKLYPGFCSGTGYVSTLHLANKVVETSPNIPFFHLEDVYLALVLKKIEYKLTWYDGFVQGARRCTNKGSGKTFTIHEIKPELMRKMWNSCGKT